MLFLFFNLIYSLESNAFYSISLASNPKVAIFKNSKGDLATNHNPTEIELIIDEDSKFSMIIDNSFVCRHGKKLRVCKPGDHKFKFDLHPLSDGYKIHLRINKISRCLTLINDKLILDKCSLNLIKNKIWKFTKLRKSNIHNKKLDYEAKSKNTAVFSRHEYSNSENFDLPDFSSEIADSSNLLDFSISDEKYDKENLKHNNISSSLSLAKNDDKFDLEDSLFD